MRKNPTLFKFLLLALILPCLYSMYLTFMRWLPADGQFASRDPLTKFEIKLAPVKAMLGDVEALSYLGDHSNPSDAEAQRNFQITQYVLAPILLTDKRPSRYAISLAPWTSQLEAEVRARDLVLARDFGGDLRL
ncbi:MAG: hypothetical protein U1F66_05105, partial [bacterium]